MAEYVAENVGASAGSLLEGRVFHSAFISFMQRASGYRVRFIAGGR
jgi:hypothetical protein